MKNSILNIGKVLKKAEQKNVNGGDLSICAMFPFSEGCINNPFPTFCISNSLPGESCAEDEICLNGVCHKSLEFG